MNKRTDYEAYPWFTLRSPLLSVSTLDRIPRRLPDLEPFLRGMYADPLVREAIQLGSYDFSRLLEKAFSRQVTVPDPGLQLSFLRYLVRLCSRCTPFGTFAGFATGMIASSTDLQVSDPACHSLHVRLDMEYLMSLSRLVSSDPEYRDQLLFTPNTSLYPVGARWHYIEARQDKAAKGKLYEVVTVDDNGILSGLLDFCHTGKRLEEIRDYLEKQGYNLSETREFTESLVRSQVLISELDPVLCGPEYLQYLSDRLTGVGKTKHAVDPIRQIERVLHGIRTPGTLLSVRGQLTDLARIPGIEYSENHLIQADMRLGCNALTVSRELSNQVLLGIRIARALSDSNIPDPLKGFREAFRRRYGDRRVELVKALDPETGIGLEGGHENYWTDPVPWIEDLNWGQRFTQSIPAIPSGNPWLGEKFHEVLARQDLYLGLSSRDLRSLNLHDGHWPAQIWALSELFTDASGETCIHLIHGAEGNPSFLLGRFGFADPGATLEWVKEMIRDERKTNPDARFAEVVHLPEDRTGNVLQRPSLYDHEIPYLAHSVKPEPERIPVTDLMVSLAGNRILLTSSSSGRPVEPRMTNAYNHNLGKLSLYKFLHRYQLQGAYPAWRPDWGFAGRNAPFVPGVRYKNLILSAPVWTFRPAELNAWIRPETGEVNLDSLILWKNRRQMPDEMIWMSGDLELYFNWENQALILALWDVIHRLKKIRVRPFYQSKSPVQGPGGSMANQILFCFKQR